MPPGAWKHVLRRILAVIGAVILLFVLHRVVFIYQWRPGYCAGSTARILLHPATAPRGAEDRRPLVVATWNIGGHGAVLDPDYIRSIAQVIRELEPDVIALQEVHRGSWQSRFRDQAGELAHDTGMALAFSPSFRSFGGEYGNAILVRGTITAAMRTDLPGVGEPRSALGARVETREGPLTLVSTHLSAWGNLNRRWRRSQVECLASQPHMAGAILAGDLNAPPAAEELQAIPAAGHRPGDPLLTPTHRLLDTKLDYLFLPPGWTAKSARVLERGPSDHFPLVVTLAREER